VNYLYGLPHYGVSVAAVTGDVRNGSWTRIAGAVSDGEGVEWTAALGHGAYRNGVRLLREGGPGLSGTLLATGFQYLAERRLAQGKIVAEMLGQVRDIRRLGSAAVDLCLVAAGTLDAYYEHGLRPWDFAAGALIASEAGLRVAGIDGGEADSHLMIAAIPEVWEELRDALERAGARQPWDL
jgi:myo-inositol-1(or 4)-monophosphatase